MAMVLVHDWLKKSDLQVIFPRIRRACEMYMMRMDNEGYCGDYIDTKVIIKKRKNTKQLLVKINSLPKPEMLISAINYMQTFNREDPIFIVNNKKKAILDSDGEVIKFEKWLKK